MNQQKVGSFLKELRSEKSVTQAELAELLGVSNRSISRWENGTTMPDFDLLIELAKYYDVEVGEILDGERRTDNMDAKTEELMLKIADYNNVERNFFSKRMCAMFLIALVGMAVYAGIDLLGLSGAEPYETIISIALGFVVGTLIVTRHFIVDGKSILYSTALTPLRHLLFADRALLSTKLCGQTEIFRFKLCVQ